MYNDALNPINAPHTLTILSEEARPYATCPNCQARLDLPDWTEARWTVRSPRDIADRLILTMSGLEQEQLCTVILDTKNHVLKVQTVYQGNVSSALARVGELYREAIRLNASAIILVHNHPSGDPTPSPDDLHLTATVLAAGRLLDIQLLDHLVIGGGEYISLRDRGVSFDRIAQ